jgi:hypothetical protein
VSAVTVIKTSSGWIPADPTTAAIHAKQKLGAVNSAEFKQIRNARFHRKYFALLNLAFDYWDVDDREYKGQPIAKNFERFRSDVQILAGYGEPVWNIRGELRMESKSIAFGKMEQEEFDALYTAVVNVLLGRVLAAKGFTRETIDELVTQITEFA